MFNPKTEPFSNHFTSFNPIGQVKDDLGTTDSGVKARKIPTNHGNFRTWSGGGVQFRAAENTGHESGVSSPPLWKTSPSRSPPVDSRHMHTQNSNRHLSPNSRSVAIARGKWELMEMVKTMPDSCYELSLKDLVDHHRVKEAEQEKSSVEENSFLEENFSLEDTRPLNYQKVKESNRQGSKRNDATNAKIIGRKSIHGGGLLLNMVFPIALGSKTKKKKKNAVASVSPKLETSMDKSSKSGSSGSSSSSGSSNRHSRRKRSVGCWSLLFSKKK